MAGAEVSIRGNEDVKTATDERGRFETPAFSVLGTTTIRVEGEVGVAGGKPEKKLLHEESLELAADEVRELDLDLYPLTIHVRLTSEADGSPIAGAEASATIQREGERSWFRPESSTANQAGEVDLLVLEPVEYSVSGEAEGFTRASSRVKVNADGATEPVTLRLPRAVVCSGRVDAAALASGASGFSHVWVDGNDNPNRASAGLQAPDYAFTLEGLAPGKYTAHLYLGGQPGEDVPFELGKEGARAQAAPPTNAARMPPSTAAST